MEETGNAVTRRQAGIGLALLGTIVLMLAGIFLLLSSLQPDSFHLFSGHTHLYFNLALGIGLITSGFVLIRWDKTKAGNRAE